MGGGGVGGDQICICMYGCCFGSVCIACVNVVFERDKERETEGGREGSKGVGREREGAGAGGK